MMTTRGFGLPIIIAIIAAVVVVGGGAYYYMGSGGYSMDDATIATGDVTGDGVDDVAAKKTKPNEINSYSFGSTNSGTDVSGTGGKAAPFTGSWNDLAKRGGNYMCTINSAGVGGVTSGTVYVSGTDLRGEFVSKTAAGQVTSNMLKKGDMMYVWSSAYPQGFMMKAEASSASTGGTATQGQGVDQGQSYDWNCTATAADASKFVKPSNIQFMDLEALKSGAGMPTMPSY